MSAKRKSTQVQKGGRKAPGVDGPRARKGPAGRRGPGKGAGVSGTPPPTPPDSYWIYGLHAVEEALANPAREIKALVMAERLNPHATERIDGLLARRTAAPPPERLPRDKLDRLLGPDAVHQGVALSVAPLAQPDLQVMAATLPAGRQTLVALDQVTDPHNVGAILRSAAAFGATAIVTTRRNAPPEGGVLAKAASGALEHVAYIQETNLARALEILKDAGFQILGLDQAGATDLPAAASAGERNVVVLGAEGRGLRPLTKETCDRLVRLPTAGPIGALNVSNAAAVALYELSGRRKEEASD
jgi:23S rRNA (guanosine2251-2'-O)-methyltransferase